MRKRPPRFDPETLEMINELARIRSEAYDRYIEQQEAQRFAEASGSVVFARPQRSS